jgi:hypothetical protein
VLNERLQILLLCYGVQNQPSKNLMGSVNSPPFMLFVFYECSILFCIAFAFHVLCAFSARPAFK